MKNIAFCAFFLLLNNFLNGQSPFRIKVVDAQTSENIEKAIVFIEEIPLPDQETDKYGIVSFQNVPEDRKVRVNIRKKGYIPNQTEVVANRALKVDNNIVIKLEKEPTTPQFIIYGEVSDKEGNELEEVTVEVSVLGKPYFAKTDKSGNYQIRIDGNLLKSVPTFQIEAKKVGCDRFKSSESVTKSEMINKDIVLQCSTMTTGNDFKPPLKAIETLKKDNLTFELLECKQMGQLMRCVCQVTSEEIDSDLSVFGKEYTRIFDAESGKEFYPTSIDIGGKKDGGAYYGTRKTIVAGYPVKITIEFGGVNILVKTISKLEMTINQRHTGTGSNKINLRNIPVIH